MVSGGRARGPRLLACPRAGSRFPGGHAGPRGGLVDQFLHQELAPGLRGAVLRPAKRSRDRLEPARSSKSYPGRQRVPLDGDRGVAFCAGPIHFRRLFVLIGHLTHRVFPGLLDELADHEPELT